MQAHLQCIHKSSVGCGGGAWAMVSCFTLHLTVFASVCITGQFMSSYSVCFKATHVHLHTVASSCAWHMQCAHAMVLEVGYSHRWQSWWSAAVCWVCVARITGNIVRRKTCFGIASHTPLAWVGRLVDGIRLLCLSCVRHQTFVSLSLFLP